MRGESGLRHTSDQALRAADAMAEELAGWKDVTLRPMFGMRAVYRRKKIFALLPARRSPGSANSFAFKFPPSAASTLRRFAELHDQVMAGAKWATLELKSGHDLQLLTEVAGIAYACAR